MRENPENSVGITYGFATVLKITGKRNGKYYTCLAKCNYNNCGKEFETILYPLKIGQTKSCGCINKKIGSKHNLWKGYGEIGGRFLTQVKKVG